MRVWLSLVGVCAACAAVPAQPKTGSCAPVSVPQRLADVREASGVAVGRFGLWTMNDSGEPLLYRLDAAGGSSRVSVAGAAIRDWEDLSIGQCAEADCLYIADIGDNRASRDRVTIYRVPEPMPGSASTQPAEIFHLAYPDRPHDAEALLVVPGPVPELLIITKEVPPAVYRVQDALKPGQSSTLSLVRTLNERVRITGAAASADGRWIALRSNRMLLIYPSEDFRGGGTPVSIDLTSLDEPQGEGVAFGRDNDLYLVSESGNDGAAGVLTRLHCAFIS